MSFFIHTIRGTACFHAGHGIEQVKLKVFDKSVSFRQSNARLWREMKEPLAPRSEAGQFIGQLRSLHSASFANGLKPSTNNDEMLVWRRSTRLRASLGGFLRASASIVPQSNGARVPRDKPLESIEKGLKK